VHFLVEPSQILDPILVHQGEKLNEEMLSCFLGEPLPQPWMVLNSPSGYADRHTCEVSLSQLAKRAVVKPCLAILDGWDGHLNVEAWEKANQEQVYGFMLKSQDSINDQVHDNGPNSCVQGVFTKCREELMAQVGGVQVVGMRVSIFNEVMMRTWQRALVLLPAVTLRAAQRTGWYYDCSKPADFVDIDGKKVAVRRVIGAAAENYKSAAFKAAAVSSAADGVPSIVEADEKTKGLSVITFNRPALTELTLDDQSKDARILALEAQVRALTAIAGNKSGAGSRPLAQVAPLMTTASLIVRKAALQSVHESEILPREKIITALEEANLKKKTKMADKADPEGANSNFSSVCGAAMTQATLGALKQQQIKTKARKELSEKKKTEKKTKAVDQAVRDRQLADPLLRQLEDGLLSADEATFLRAAGGVQAAELEALVRVLGGKPGKTRAETAKSVVELFKTRKARSAALANSTQPVEMKIMTTNLARIREAKLPNFAEVKAMSLVDAYFATATFLLNQETVLSIYGGFVRDLVLRNDFHSELDIDVHVSESTISQTKERICAWGRGAVYCSTDKGKHVTNVSLAIDSGKISVDLVNCSYFTSRSKAAKKKVIDLDINNLKLTSNGLTKREEDEGDSLDTIIQHVLSKQFRRIKPDQEIADRLVKFQKLGWVEIVKASSGSRPKSKPATLMRSSLLQSSAPLTLKNLKPKVVMLSAATVSCWRVFWKSLTSLERLNGKGARDVVCGFVRSVRLADTNLSVKREIMEKKRIDLKINVDEHFIILKCTN